MQVNSEYTSIYLCLLLSADCKLHSLSPQVQIITGPPTHSVGGKYCFALWRVVVCRLSSSVTHHGGPAGGFTRAGQAMTSRCLQPNYSFTVTLQGGPVVLRPVKATPCFVIIKRCCMRIGRQWCRTASWVEMNWTLQVHNENKNYWVLSDYTWYNRRVYDTVRYGLRYY